MIIEIDTNILDKIKNITMNQLVFLSLVSNDNQNSYQNIQKLLSLVNEEEIQDLINRKLISVEIQDTNKVYKTSEEYNKHLCKKDFFDQFYNAYPVYVIRPDGTKGFLRTNVNKCRHEYNKIVGKSATTHNHIMACLNSEVTEKLETGKLCYMKTMWKWLVNRGWEEQEERLKIEDTAVTSSTYGTELQ